MATTVTRGKIRAKTWLAHGNRLIPPGAVIEDGMLPPYAIESVLLHGEATEDGAEARAAAALEDRRQRQVALEQATRSEKGSQQDPEKLAQVVADADEEFVEIAD